MTGGRGVCGKQRVIFAGHVKEETEGGNEEGTIGGKKQGSKQENKQKKKTIG